MKRFIQFGHGSPGFASIYVYPNKNSGNDSMIGQLTLHQGSIDVWLPESATHSDAKLLLLISRNIGVFEELLGAQGARQWSIMLEEEE